MLWSRHIDGHGQLLPRQLVGINVIGYHFSILALTEGCRRRRCSLSLVSRYYWHDTVATVMSYAIVGDEEGHCRFAVTGYGLIRHWLMSLSGCHVSHYWRRWLRHYEY